jgi:muramoyltetrapeptide carboxypeptidase
MPLLRPNDVIRLVSPASRSDPAATERRIEILRGWGLRVEIAPHAFDKFSYLAGSDDDRLSDLADALLVNPTVRAIFATRGGKGSYRILHRLPFAAMTRDPKPVIGFSDITAQHLALWRECASVGVRGSLTGGTEERLSEIAAEALRFVLMDDGPIAVAADRTMPSAALTTSGIARGPLVGGNLDMIAATAGWALPSLRGAILLIESAGLGIGQFDRTLTMLTRAGHLDGSCRHRRRPSERYGPQPSARLRSAAASAPVRLRGSDPRRAANRSRCRCAFRADRGHGGDGCRWRRSDPAG